MERAAGEARLVTLTGTGGTGKTRLALEAGARVAGRFPDGVWLAELAGIADPGLVAAQVMAALGVRQAGDVPVLEALIYRLRPAELLLVLDNCEHLLDACARAGRRAAARRARGCGCWRPAASRWASPVRSRTRCGRWTCRRAGRCAARPGRRRRCGCSWTAGRRRGAGRAAGWRRWRWRSGSAASWTGCRWRSSWPRRGCGTLSAAEIEAHLADRFRFLAYRRPAADPRHQALRAAMDWSYELLSAEERRVLAELSVFAGTFGLAQVGRGLQRRGSAGGAGDDRPAGRQVAGGGRAGRGRDPLPAAGHGPPLRGGPARRGRAAPRPPGSGTRPRS